MPGRFRRQVVGNMGRSMITQVRVGDLVRLKPAHIIRQQNDTLDPDEEYDPDDWVGVVVSFPGFEQKSGQQELFETCLVMWKGRQPVGEFVDHLEVLQ